MIDELAAKRAQHREREIASYLHGERSGDVTPAPVDPPVFSPWLAIFDAMVGRGARDAAAEIEAS